MRTYGKIENFRLLDVKVFVDDVLKYEGRVEDAPDDIKELYYSKVITSHPIQIYVYSNTSDEETNQDEQLSEEAI
jgi:hypothetical protein